MPNKINVIGFREAKEIKADICAVPHNGPVDYTASLAYAVGSHWLVAGSYRHVKNLNSREQIYNDSNIISKNKIDVTLSGHCVEASGGYFTELNDGGYIEAIAGIANGYNKCTMLIPGMSLYPQTHFEFGGQYNKAFIQLGYSIGNDNFQYLTGFRQSFINYYVFDAINPDLKYSLSANERTDLTKHAFGLFEPYMEGRAGGKQLKFMAQTGIAVQLSGPALGTTFLSPYMTFGLCYNYTPRFKTKKHI